MSVKKTRAVAAGKTLDESVSQNSERDCQRLFQRLGMSLPIPIIADEHHVEVAETKIITTYRIKPQSWVKHWMEKNPELLGGISGDAMCNFENFWKCYEIQHPTHAVFRQHRSRLNHVVPLLIHGDEGRAVKKTNYLVVSIESPLGSVEDDRPSTCSCTEEISRRANIPTYGSASGTIGQSVLDACKLQRANLKGHSYLSRWLIFGLGGWIYKKKHPQIVDFLMSNLSSEMTSLFNDGICLDDGTVIYGALVAVKGDMDFHHKIFSLKRSYSHLGKKNELEICHHCKAGCPLHPFEDFGESPSWSQTMWLDRPWCVERSVPSLATIPFDPSAPERMLAGDIFHIVKSGIGRDVAGGCLIVLMRKGFFDFEGSSQNLPDRFDRAHSNFALWCRAEGESPSLRSFSKSFWNMKDLVSAPYCSSKASDTVLLVKWLHWFVSLNIFNPIVDGYSEILRQMQQVCGATLGLNKTYGHGLWMPRDCGRLFYVNCMTLLRGYTVLGRRCITMGIRAFIMKPKHHALHHLAFHIRKQLLSEASLVSNPTMTSCDSNEDFLGRISRLSRRVGFRLVDLRVIQRYFMKINALLRKRNEQAKRPTRKGVKRHIKK